MAILLERSSNPSMAAASTKSVKYLAGNIRQESCENLTVSMALPCRGCAKGGQCDGDDANLTLTILPQTQETADEKQICNKLVEKCSLDEVAPATSADGNEIDPDTGLPSSLEKICTIGTGTFGRVLLCKSKKSQEFLALKLMSIKTIVRTKQVQHVHSEKRLLMMISHPFIVKMHLAYHDKKFLYMLFDYLPGGELFSYLRAYGHFENNAARFFAAEIVLTLQYLHEKSIIYRDLKPENLILDKRGHIKLTDFGFAKELRDRTWTLCGTPEYLAPEIIEGKGHNKAVDWWALGILVFEMLAGYPPFNGDNPLRIYERILDGNPKYPPYFDLCAKDLTRKLLVTDRTKRIGNMKNGAEDVKNHKWFSVLVWNDVLNMKLQPPILPNLSHDGDPGNFDEYEEQDIRTVAEATPAELELFENW